MDTVHVQFGATCPIGQVEGFPEFISDGDKKRPFERSCSGAIHLMPGITKQLTKDELAHIQQDKIFGRHAMAIGENKRQNAKATTATKAEAATPAAKSPAPAKPSPAPSADNK